MLKYTNINSFYLMYNRMAILLIIDGGQILPCNKTIIYVFSYVEKKLYFGKDTLTMIRYPFSKERGRFRRGRSIISNTKFTFSVQILFIETQHFNQYQFFFFFLVNHKIR